MNAIVRTLRACAGAAARLLSRIARASLAALSLVLALELAHASAAHAAQTDAKIRVVAAENFYGDVVRQIGGAYVEVTSILNNPDQDPHLFEASPKTARALERATIVVYNGADYDPWMDKLLSVSKNPKRMAIMAARIAGRKSGDNPHLWYDPATMPTIARELASALAKADPAHRAEFEANLARFIDSMKPLQAKVAELRTRYSGVSVTATEPVFGYMADALGLDMRNQRLQLAVMNETEPSAADIAAFENDLRQKKVRALIYNSQASDELVKRLLQLAHRSGVPTTSVTETLPASKTYQQWMLGQLDALADALASKQP